MSYIYDKKVLIDDSSQLDALGRLRISGEHIIFSSTLKYNNEPFLWNDVSTGSGSSTYSTSQQLCNLSVTTNGDSYIRQTREYFQVYTGSSYMTIFSGNFESTPANVSKKMGIFDTSNGIYFENTSSGTSLVIRTNITGTVTNTSIPQSSWNIDTLDGNGPSKVNIDWTKMQLFVMDYAWTGIGRLRIGVMINGSPVYCHIIEGVNNLTTNTFSAPSLPIRYEIVSTGGSSTMKQQASTILVEDNNYYTGGITRSVNRGSSTKSISSNWTPLISIRLNSSYKRAKLQPIDFNLLTTNTSYAILYGAFLRNTLSGASWTSAGLNSISEYDTNASGLSGGYLLTSGYLGDTGGYFSGNGNNIIKGKLDNIVNVLADYNDTPDIFTIAAKVVSGSSLTMLASLDYLEIY